MERRALLAVVISLVILLAYEQGMRFFYPPPPFSESSGTSTSTEAPPPDAAERAAAQDPTSPPPAVPSAPERLVTVDAPLYTATFSSNGARLVGMRLKNYRTTVQPDSAPQEMIVPGAAREAPVGVELRGPQGVQTISDAQAPYVADRDSLDIGNGTGDLLFSWVADGLTVHKRFTFHPDSYKIDGLVDLRNVPSGYNEVVLSWPKADDPVKPPGSGVVFDKAVHLNGKKLVEHAFADLQGETIEGDVRWTGYGGAHFFAAIAPKDARNPRLWLKRVGTTVEQKLLLPVSGTNIPVPFELYIGPKDPDALEHAGTHFGRAVDLGWFGFIALPLLHVLQLSHRFTGNYGIDIILLTVVIKVLFIPLTHKSFKSMQAMQKLQPQMQKIREKMKDTPEEMNKEIMEMYRRHKVNPFGGCLPMLLQIPVFIGLYTALMSNVELRHAPFMLWITDLAAPDRLGSIQLPFVEHPGIPVLTLLMGVSMFVQQWMTPTMGDPAQRQVMMIMPLMFTVMFVNFPSGLSLYWLVNNVLTIAQQYQMNRSQPKPGG